MPALRKGQYSTEGCNGQLAFKRRYTDEEIDSYALVTISGNATFTGLENGTYRDCITGDIKTVTNRTLTVSCNGKGNLRVYVLDTDKTKAPGKIGVDGQYLCSSPVYKPQSAYDGTQEESSSNNGDNGNNSETHIDSIISADNTTVEYYNLQGIRVQNPTKGIYIKKQGDKKTKVVL